MLDPTTGFRGASAALAAALLFVTGPALAGTDALEPVQAAQLDTAQTMTRVAFGSCNRQDKPQDVWTAIAATSPQVFLSLGDNVYGDIGWDGGADLQSFRDAYAMEAANPQFRAFRRSVPILATWDDHDFGPNDSGGDFAFKQASEDLFEAYWNSDETVRGRPGVYQSAIVGPKGRRVQLILLDTRYFRTPLELRGNGYVPDEAAGQEMLGEEQWRWLAAELAKPAEIRLLASSIQVLSQAHRFEKWANLPRERERLFRVLAGRAGGEIVLLSGDRHSGGIYSGTPAALGDEVWEITSSSLNSPSGTGDVSAREPDPSRRSMLYASANFGLVDIDWRTRQVTLRLLSDKGFEVASQEIAF